MAFYRKFIPSLYYPTIFDIDYLLLKKEGITTLFFDLDNTIIPNDVKQIDNKSLEFLQQLQQNFKVLILSNNVLQRVKFASFTIPYVYKANKPLKKGFKQALKLVNSTKEETASIGDQLLTDIFGSRRVHLKHQILVNPLNKRADLKRTRFNRFLAKHFIKKIKKHDFVSYSDKLREYDEKV
ncbi:MAG: hypothetical protein LBV55_04070 [Acholeplasmatales bacterium]|jgi:HAD superfamily phosphatase (TIGR01668 family)|nr:hypothetical protein [Acholeplasmatales bacterium]